jgi:hypothetical protein
VDTDCDGLVDDSPTCGCTPLEVGNAKFAVCDQPLPYAEAEAFCQACGETLARLDRDDAAAVHSAIQAASGSKRAKLRWWIGLHDRAQEGKFAWLSGATPYTNWERGEPDNAGCDQDCVAIDVEDGRWNDTHCNEHKPFLCRAP